MLVWCLRYNIALRDQVQRRRDTLVNELRRRDAWMDPPLSLVHLTIEVSSGVFLSFSSSAVYEMTVFCHWRDELADCDRRERESVCAHDLRFGSAASANFFFLSIMAKSFDRERTTWLSLLWSSREREQSVAVCFTIQSLKILRRSSVEIIVSFTLEFLFYKELDPLQSYKIQKKRQHKSFLFFNAEAILYIFFLYLKNI